jgi:hypothetical protein
MAKKFIPYDQMEFKDVRETFKPVRTPLQTSATLFHEGDHWQNSNGWIGPRPWMKDGTYFIQMKEIEDAFVSENAIKECNDRHHTGVLGREPRWNYLIPSKVNEKETPKPIVTANAAATIWWNTDNAVDILGQSLIRCLNEDRAVLRFYIPEGFLNDDGTFNGDVTDLQSAMSNLSLELCDNANSGVFFDKRTKQHIGVLYFKRDDEEWLEIVYVDRETKDTVIRQICAARGVDPVEARYKLNGLLTMFEVRRPALTTKQVQSCQKSLNVADTMMMRNVNQAGSLERYFLNAEEPSEIVEVPDATQVSGVKRIKRSIPFRTGAGTTMFLKGALIYNENGEVVGRSDPNINYKDPVDVTTFVDTCDKFYSSILGQYQQKMYLLAAEGNVGADSRESAKEEFRSSLKFSKRSIDPAGRWILDVLLTWALDLMGNRNEFEEVISTFDCVIDVQFVSMTIKKEDRADVKDRLMSSTTYISKYNEDPDAEVDRIQKDDDAPEVGPWSPKAIIVASAGKITDTTGTPPPPGSGSGGTGE